MNINEESLRIAKALGMAHELDWHFLRDAVDLHSGGGLDTWQLDKLTDEVARRIEHSRRGKGNVSPCTAYQSNRP